MATRYKDYSIVSAAKAAIFAMILAACSLPYDQTVQTATLLNAQVGLVETKEMQEAVNTRIPFQASTPAPEKPAVITTSPGVDGTSILARRCAQCHPTQIIEQTKKTSIEWEASLAKMEVYGLKLDANEKALLIDYLLAGQTR
jgi:cytochrome c5